MTSHGERQPPRTGKRLGATAARPDGRPPSDREKALAWEVVTLLQPALAEMSRKLDGISQKVDELLALLAQLDTGRISTLLSRLEAGPTAAPRDGAPKVKGNHEPRQEQ
jgi:hypothetical protein